MNSALTAPLISEFIRRQIYTHIQQHNIKYSEMHIQQRNIEYSEMQYSET